jgi:fatty-acyl-CoA synthase
MICYTSGTTGNPKGVVYSHRSTVLHTLVACMADTLGISERDSVLPVVPMFHANAWGLPQAAICAGASLVFPGPHLDPTSLLDLMASEKVTVAAGVPTIWLGILALLDQDPKKWDLGAVRSMVIGGSAAPAAMIDGFEKRHGLTVTHAWGMTETNPLGTLARVKHRLRDVEPGGAARDARLAGLPRALRRAAPRERGRDGAALGRRDHGRARGSRALGGVVVRGRRGAGSLHRRRVVQDGRRGDDRREGYLRITDRSKDVIKSGGEWISSVALENALMSHPAVLEAAVFAAQHPKWAERPIAAVVLKPGKSATQARSSRRTSRAASRSSGCRTTTCSSRRSRGPRRGSS